METLTKVLSALNEMESTIDELALILQTSCQELVIKLMYADDLTLGEIKAIALYTQHDISELFGV